MQEQQARALTVEAGRELLEKGLVARTWGNVSCRVDGDTMVISPSGLDYIATREEDTVVVSIASGEWDKAQRKPSSERGVHRAAYQRFPEVGFVIHTHQDCASALSLAGFDALALSAEEERALGGIALADYGLSGTKKLTKAVSACLATGAHTVLMAKHGALICAENKEEAMARSALLEEVCRRALRAAMPVTEGEDASLFLSCVKEIYPHAGLVATPTVLSYAAKGRALPAQLDDMAQMIGAAIPVAETEEQALRLIGRRAAVLLPGMGILVNADDPDDAEALKLLCHKAALCALHTEGCGVRSRVALFDALLMRRVYLTKYSKQKQKE